MILAPTWQISERDIALGIIAFDASGIVSAIRDGNTPFVLFVSSKIDCTFSYRGETEKQKADVQSRVIFAKRSDEDIDQLRVVIDAMSVYTQWMTFNVDPKTITAIADDVREMVIKTYFTPIK